MIIDTYTHHRALPLGQQLARNIKHALLVAGGRGAGRRALPLSSVTVQQRTGIARSTLRMLVNGGQDGRPNPDLHTLVRLAEALGIPVAFLLMRQEDWRTLARAVNGLQSPSHAAAMLLAGDTPGNPLDTPEQVLQRCGMHPERVTHGLEANPAAVAQVEERNENRRRGSQILASLMLPAADTRNERVLMTALAATLAHELSYQHQPAVAGAHS